jgi:hypothetical protein
MGAEGYDRHTLTGKDDEKKGPKPAPEGLESNEPDTPPTPPTDPPPPPGGGDGDGGYPDPKDAPPKG